MIIALFCIVCFSGCTDLKNNENGTDAGTVEIVIQPENTDSATGGVSEEDTPPAESKEEQKNELPFVPKKKTEAEYEDTQTPQTSGSDLKNTASSDLYEGGGY